MSTELCILLNEPVNSQEKKRNTYLEYSPIVVVWLKNIQKLAKYITQSFRKAL